MMKVTVQDTETDTTPVSPTDSKKKSVSMQPSIDAAVAEIEMLLKYHSAGIFSLLIEKVTRLRYLEELASRG